MVNENHTPDHIAQIHEQLWQTILQFGNFAASQERNRIARDLHDSLGHALTALNVQIKTAIKLWQLDPEQAQHFLVEANRLGSLAIKEVRQSVGALRSDAAETQPLDSLIAALREEFYQTTGVLPTAKIDVSIDLPQEIVTPLYRIVQEALNNIRKYAQATTVQIAASATPYAVSLVIQDDGRGFKPEEATTGFGLQGMRERVALLRGEFHLNSAPGAGCRIEVKVPLQLHRGEEQVELLSGSAQPIDSTADLGGSTGSLIDLLTPFMATVDSGEIDLDGLHTHLAWTPEQIHQLERLLLAQIGPIAPQLIQQAASRASTSEALLEALIGYLPAHEQAPFRQQAILILKEEVDQPQLLYGAYELNPLAADRDFIQHCEQELTVIVGPIASLLVQKALANAPQVSREELVKSLAIHIADAQAALEFQRRLLSFGV